MLKWILSGIIGVLVVGMVVMFCLNYEVTIDRETTIVVAPTPAPTPVTPVVPPVVVVPPSPPAIACNACEMAALVGIPLADQGSLVLAEARASCAEAGCR